VRRPLGTHVQEQDRASRSDQGRPVKIESSAVRAMASSILDTLCSML